MGLTVEEQEIDLRELVLDLIDGFLKQVAWADDDLGTFVDGGLEHRGVQPVSQFGANDGNGCYSALSEAYNFIASSSPEQSEESLIIYPNPSTGMINLSGTFLDNRLFTVIVSDMTGKPLLQIDNKSSIDLSSLKNGIYFLKIKLTAGNVLIKKIILSR